MMPGNNQFRVRPGAKGLFSGVCLLLCLAFSTCAEPGVAQELQNRTDYSRNPEWFPRVYKPYVMQKIPDVQLTNSANLLRLIHGGNLEISLDQLRTAVRENNLDILASNNAARYAETDMLRAKGGGAPRGGGGVQIPSGLFAGAIGAGTEGGGGLGGFGSAGGITGGARQVRAFPRGSYDPSLSLGLSIDRTKSPLNSIVVSGLPEVTTTSTSLQARYSQAFTSGTSISVSFNNMRQSSTQRFLLYNPDFVSTFSFTVTQQLMNGFGYSVNRRFLEVAKNEAEIMKEIVRSQLNTTLAEAQNTYWDVVAAGENVRVAEQSLAVARRLYDDNKTREEFGRISGLEVVTAESEVAARERDLVIAQTVSQTREVDLKNAVSKEIDPALGLARVIPTDTLPDPEISDIPTLNKALETAMVNRPEIHQAEINILIQGIAIKYNKNLLKPSLLAFAMFNSSGLFGNRIIDNPNGGAPIVLPGGMSQAIRQVRSWSYPEYAFGLSFSINIHNSAAKADSYRAKLDQRQTETALQGTRNRIALEVRKAVIGLVQSRARVEAARKAMELSGQALQAEEARLSEGVSIPYDVIRRQRDFRSAQLADVQARANYAKALVELNRSMGILDRDQAP